MADSAGGHVARKRSYRALASVAVRIQVGLVSVVGLGLQDGDATGDRSGWRYVATLAQALVILTVAGALLWTRPGVAAALPLLSLFLVVAAEVIHANSTKACTAAGCEGCGI